MENQEKKKKTSIFKNPFFVGLGGLLLGGVVVYVTTDENRRNSVATGVKSLGNKVGNLFSGSKKEEGLEAVGTKDTTAPQHSENQPGYQRPYYGGGYNRRHHWEPKVGKAEAALRTMPEDTNSFNQQTNK